MKKLWIAMFLSMAFLLTACGEKAEPAASEGIETEPAAMTVVEDADGDSSEDATEDYKSTESDAESTDTASVDTESTDTEAADANESSESASSGSVVYDDHDVVIEYVGTSTDEYGANYLLNLTVCNNSDHAIYITDNDYTFLVDGCQINGKFSGQNIPAGSCSEVVIEVSGSDLEDEVGVESMDECSEASIGIRIDNADTDETLDAPMISISL